MYALKRVIFALPGVLEMDLLNLITNKEVKEN